MKEVKLVCFVRLSAFVLLGIFVPAGCATIISGTSQEMSFTSEPDGATVTVSGRILGKTPLTVQLKKKSGQTLMFEKEGYKTHTMTLETTMEGWFWGNILLGGFFGSTTDGITGAVYEYAPSQYYVNLVPDASRPMIPLGNKAEAKVFIVAGYNSIIKELNLGKGEYLSSLFTLLKLAEGEQADALEKIRILAKLYPSIPEFAERVASYYLK